MSKRRGAHLDRVLVVRDLVGLRRHNAAPAERLGLEARDARLEGGLARGAGLLVPANPDAGVARGRAGKGRAAAHVSFSSGASAMYSASWGGITNMLGETP